jgi:uncharacterized membrane protein (UPF0127 family)
VAKTVRLERPDGHAVCERCLLAETPLARVKGLLGRSKLDPDEGILLRPASSIHTWFMRFPIDAVFVDRELAVVGVVANLKPWRAAARRGAHAVVELAAGESDRRGLRLGDRLVAA